jgi:hypothetical protein
MRKEENPTLSRAWGLSFFAFERYHGMEGGACRKGANNNIIHIL